MRGLLSDWAHLLGQKREEMPTQEEIDNVEYKLECDEKRDKLKKMADKQRTYLITRKICALSNSAAYRRSEATDVRRTMREFVDAELPHLREKYGFLYTNE